jgi:co-chaperonin GroES (HSP10)
MDSLNHTHVQSGVDLSPGYATRLGQVLTVDTFRPIASKVAIRVKKVTQTSGGVMLPEGSAQERWESCEATVVAVGPECKQVKVGDRILTNPSTVGDKVRFMRDELLLVDEVWIAGILTLPSESAEPAQTKE